MSETPSEPRTSIDNDRRRQAGSAATNSPAPGSRSLQAGGEFLKALAGDLAAVAARLRASRRARRRRTPPPPRTAVPAPASAGPSAGRVLWRLSVVLLGLGSICAGVLCALMLWVLFGFPLEARNSEANAPGSRVETASGAPIGNGGAAPAAEVSRPEAGGQPATQIAPAAGSGSSSPAAAEPGMAAKATAPDAGAGSDQPRLARTEMLDRPAAAAPPQPQISPPLPQQPPAAATASPAPMQCNVALCEGRYNSFRASDCTYQPYGGGPRRICAMSSEATGAAAQTPAAGAPSSDIKETRLAATAEAATQSATPARAEAQCNVAACSARYNSFRASDCTYQPYGGGTRQICELSSRSAEAPQMSVAATTPRTAATGTTVAAPAVEIDESSMPARAAAQCDVAACAAEYHSFHAADCTYQPYGGGPRRICER
jgi:BA14K-like protein